MRVIIEVRAKRETFVGFVADVAHDKAYWLTTMQSNYNKRVWLLEIVSSADEIEKAISNLDNSDSLESIKVIYCDDK